MHRLRWAWPWSWRARRPGLDRRGFWGASSAQAHYRERRALGALDIHGHGARGGPDDNRRWLGHSSEAVDVRLRRGGDGPVGAGPDRAGGSCASGWVAVAFRG